MGEGNFNFENHHNGIYRICEGYKKLKKYDLIVDIQGMNL